MIIYGPIYLIDMIKNIYYKKTDNNSITNEEYDKITNLGVYKSKSKFNIFDINLSGLKDYKKSDLHQLDGYISKNINERNYKKQIVNKIEELL